MGSETAGSSAMARAQPIMTSFMSLMLSCCAIRPALFLQKNTMVSEAIDCFTTLTAIRGALNCRQIVSRNSEGSVSVTQHSMYLRWVMVVPEVKGSTPIHPQAASGPQAGCAVLVDVLLRLFLTNLQRGPSHCLWENGFTGQSVCGQAIFQASFALVK